MQAGFKADQVQVVGVSTGRSEFVGCQFDRVTVGILEVDRVRATVVLETEIDAALYEMGLCPLEILPCEHERDVAQADGFRSGLVDPSMLRLEESNAGAEVTHEGGQSSRCGLFVSSSPSTSRYQAIEWSRSLTFNET
jgi:hypothetical protein